MVLSQCSRWLLVGAATLFSTVSFAQEDTVLTVTGIPNTQQLALSS